MNKAAIIPRLACALALVLFAIPVVAEEDAVEQRAEQDGLAALGARGEQGQAEDRREGAQVGPVVGPEPGDLPPTAHYSSPPAAPAQAASRDSRTASQ